MSLEERPLPYDKVLSILSKRLRRDKSFRSGKILGSMCTNPHRLAVQIYQRYMDRNLGDPGLHPETVKLEEEAVKMMGSLLSNPHPYGHIVSGGTEANILALWAARNLARERKEVILPINSHFSFDRAADLLGLKLVKIRLRDHVVDVDEVKRRITKKTLMLVGIAGSTDLGLVDPIVELSELAEAHSLPLHVDASFGGFVLPFLKETGHRFDFRLKGVWSITVDPHKMGMAPIPAGGILFRHPEALKAIGLQIDYLSGGPSFQSTLLATRPGASAIAVWALLKLLGRAGFRRIVKRCIDLTQYLYDEVSRIEKLRAVTKPVMNILGITSKELPKLAEGLRMKGWAISLYPTHIRVVVMPHVRRRHIERFLEDLRGLT
ncbi:MAG: tyrosine decarboxylase MfnA [Nitrososphaerota archaeon]